MLENEQTLGTCRGTHKIHLMYDGANIGKMTTASLLDFCLMGIYCICPKLLCCLTDRLELQRRPDEGLSSATALSDSFAQSLHINLWQKQLPYTLAFPNNTILIHGFTNLILAQIGSFADKATDWAIHSCNGMALPPRTTWGICKFSALKLEKDLVMQSLLWKNGFWIPALQHVVFTMHP